MKVYFDVDIIKKYGKEWVPFLYPILGEPIEMIQDNTGFYDKKQVKKWEIVGKKCLIFEKVIKECDYVVFPIDFKIDYLDVLENVCKQSMKYGKKVIMFYYNDCERPVPNKYNNLIVFRTSLTKQSPQNEFSMPGFSEDLGSSYGVQDSCLDVSVGYVGYVGYDSILTFIKYCMIKIKFYIFDNFVFYNILIYSGLLSKIAWFLGKIGIIKDEKIFKNSLLYYMTAKGKGLEYRNKVISEVKKLKIKFNFIKRKRMLDNEVVSVFRKQYVDNLKQSLFPVVVRGDGNYSYRLYEVMSLGKIPIFIDTNSVLPLSDRIDYKNLFIYVPFENIVNIEKYIDDYLNKNKGKLGYIQGKIRDIYVNNLTLTGFFLQIIQKLSEYR